MPKATEENHEVSMISVLAVSLAEHIPKIRFRAYMKMVKA
jgi:hypothetical protein